MSSDKAPNEPDFNGSKPKYGAANAGDTWTIMSYLLSGIFFWGGAGWLIDRWLETNLALLIGMIVGAGASLYVVWLRYGRQ
jgi:ATP synthase protein I